MDEWNSMKSKSTRLLAEASVKEYIRSEKSYKRKGLQEKKIWFHISIRKKTSHLKELLPWLDEWRPATGFWNCWIKSIPRCSKPEFKQSQNLNLKATTSEPIHRCKKRLRPQKLGHCRHCTSYEGEEAGGMGAIGADPSWAIWSRKSRSSQK